MIVIKLKIIFSLSYKKMNSSKGEEQQKNGKSQFCKSDDQLNFYTKDQVKH
jgi:hypothetical protein